MPHRVCLEAGCPEWATYRGRCSTHSKERDQTIGRAGRAIYSLKRWKLTRRHKLGLNPVCERCQNELAEHVHHKHGVENDPWSLAGLSALCPACHGIITRAEQLQRMT